MTIRMLGTTLIIALTAASAAAVAQEPGHKAAAAQPAPTAAAMADKPAGTSAPSTGDSLALGLLGAINQHEIDAAKQAKAKKVSGAVLDYAQTMQKEHGENLAKTKTLGPLSTAADVQAQKDKGAAELKTLNTVSGAAYAKAYMDAMVKGHTEALGLIDSKLLPAATSVPVKEHLTQTRAHVAMHLDKAKAIVATL